MSFDHFIEFFQLRLGDADKHTLREIHFLFINGHYSVNPDDDHDHVEELLYACYLAAHPSWVPVRQFTPISPDSSPRNLRGGSDLFIEPEP